MNSTIFFTFLMIAVYVSKIVLWSSIIVFEFRTLEKLCTIRIHFYMIYVKITPYVKSRRSGFYVNNMQRWIFSSLKNKVKHREKCSLSKVNIFSCQPYDQGAVPKRTLLWSGKVYFWPSFSLPWHWTARLYSSPPGRHISGASTRLRVWQARHMQSFLSCILDTVFSTKISRLMPITKPVIRVREKTILLI